MHVSSVLRQRVRELEQREDYRGLHRLLRGWPWPPDERPDVMAAFDEVTRRIALFESHTLEA